MIFPKTGILLNNKFKNIKWTEKLYRSTTQKMYK